MISGNFQNASVFSRVAIKPNSNSDIIDIERSSSQISKILVNGVEGSFDVPDVSTSVFKGKDNNHNLKLLSALLESSYNFEYFDYNFCLLTI